MTRIFNAQCGARDYYGMYFIIYIIMVITEINYNY